MLFKTSAVQQPDGYLSRIPWFQFLLISLCFPLWGAAASLNDILITQFKSVFTLSDLATAFVQSAFYGGYFVIAIPASRIIRRFTYKTGILIGLGVYIVGCAAFFPASHMATYSMFLVALFAIAIGLSFLETAGNTYSTMLGPKPTSTLRLNISQTFTPLGSILGILLGKYLVFTDGDTLDAQMAGMTMEEKTAFSAEMLQRTLLPYRYIIMILVVVFIVVALTKFPHCKPLGDRTHLATARVGETLAYLARNKEFLRGIFAQFMYVGMQTAVWSFTIRLALNLDDSINERDATNYMVFAFAAFFLGKTVANFLIARFDVNAVLMGFAALGSLALVYVMLVPNITAVWAAVLVSGLFGPCWATIFGRTLDTITDKRHQETGGAVLVMAIVGGAVIPVVQGLVSDATGSLQFSFVVSLVCFVTVLLHFGRQRRITGRTISTEKEAEYVSH
ncbi:L-fucose:H+ symporter permease [Arthrobacter sp. zg-Y1110]|uniref:L-fucose:H+ symporter permease n=1 Tax=Arthrobacter sp. zg-Y1110 TaxID=2886932 RepID=UPI001D13BA3D|nr:L-fucose:H+ symporter permease [Arthrobacter sp. zg-Y1110]MCC3291849.1 L-fucose:H+ symporter permease [Arthrobacter sp. zg-Y1110]